MSDFVNKIHHIVAGQLPVYIEEKFPAFVRFIEWYYKFLMESGEAHRILLDGENWSNIDKTLDIFLPQFRAQFAADIPDSALLDTRRLIKVIHDYYEAKGSENATEMFFRFMYNLDATVSYPGEYVLRASDGRWQRKKFIKIDTEIFPEENIFDLKGKKFSLVYAHFVPGVGLVRNAVEVSCFDIIKQVEPNIYQLEVDINPQYEFPAIIPAVEDYDIDLDGSNETIQSLGDYDTHIYAIKDDVIYGSISKQLVGIEEIQTPGSNFRIDDAYIISEFGVEGKYFGRNYVANKETDIDTEYAAYVVETFDNNAIIRVKDVEPFKTTTPIYVQDSVLFFAEDYIERGGVRRGSGIDEIQIVRTGQRFSARRPNTLLDTSYFVIENNPTDIANYIYNPVSNTGPDDYATDIQELVAVDTFVVDLFPRYPRNLYSTQGSRIVFRTGEIYHEPGRFKDSHGFLSDVNHLQDNYYYQPFSYVVKVEKPLKSWKDIYRASNHPAGFQLFSEYLIRDTVSLTHTAIDNLGIIFVELDELVAVDDNLLINYTLVLPRSYFFSNYMDDNNDYVYEDSIHSTDAVFVGGVPIDIEIPIGDSLDVIDGLGVTMGGEVISEEISVAEDITATDMLIVVGEETSEEISIVEDVTATDLLLIGGGGPLYVEPGYVDPGYAA